MQQDNTPVIQLGTAMEGGFFGGIINVDGQHKGVIWAPKKEGQIVAALMPPGRRVTTAFSPYDCQANTQALLALSSPAAQRVTDLEINGHKDWLIPSRDVLELGYRHFKPTGYQNYCSWRDGENPNSVPPGWLYTTEQPGQTQIEHFRDAEAEAFDDHWYWSSTVLPNGETAFIQLFNTGDQYYYGLSYEGRVRAVRLIQL